MNYTSRLTTRYSFLILFISFLFALPLQSMASSGYPTAGDADYASVEDALSDSSMYFMRYSDYPLLSDEAEELSPEDLSTSELLHGYDVASEPVVQKCTPPFSLDDTEGHLTPEFFEPLIIHSDMCRAPVERNIRLFSERMKERFATWLSRSGRYVPMMKDILKENGLPEDLVYIALIESGFNPKAYSWAKAAGPWQFISATGKRYGLKVDWWVDERRDPVKSTRAAAMYLSDLYDMFGTWSLSMAAYNAGEGRVSRAVKQHGTLDFWRLIEAKALVHETREYVPRFMAARAIASNPEAYGLVGIEYQPPFEFDTVALKVPLGIDVAAKCCGVSPEVIKDLNPELKRWCTPPDTPGYELRVPKGARDAFLTKFASLPDSEKTGWSEYVVRRGDTLGNIASHYNVPVSVIAQTNNIRRVSVISVGQRLVIPSAGATTVSYSPPSGVGYADDGNPTYYKIRRGDTLHRIARRHGMSTTKLARLNSISTNSIIRPGQKLRVSGRADESASASSAGDKYHRVKSGDTLWNISRRYGVDLTPLLKANSLSRRSVIKPGQRLLIPTTADGSA